MVSRRVLLAATIAACVAGPAAAALDLVAANGDRIDSTLDLGSEVESFRIACPAGAAITAKAKAAKGGPQLRLRLSDPKFVPVSEDTGPKPALKSAPATATGVYTIDVSSFDGASTGAYTLAISWKSPVRFSATANVGAGGQAELKFGADAGAKAKFRARAGRLSDAVPALVKVTGPSGFSMSLAPGPGGAATLPHAGEYVLTFADGGAAGGALSATVTLTPPKVTKRSLNFGAGSVPGNASALFAGVIGPTGGSLVAQVGSPITGASVTIPPGALPQATSVLLGSADPIVTALPGTPAGPAIFIGPEGLTFEDGLSATVTIPYDPALFPLDTGSLAVFTRDADGDLVEIEGAVVDLVAHTVTFATSHFSAFAVRREFDLAEIARLVDQAGTIGADFGAALAVDGGTIAVGAPKRDLDAATPQVGAVLAFRRLVAGWSQEASFVLTRAETQDAFGTSVAVSGDTLIAGGPGRKGPSGAPTGAAYVYVRDMFGMWTGPDELVPPNAAGGDEVGASVSLDGDTAIVGAPGDSQRQAGSGAAHVFFRRAGAWGYQARLEAPAPLSGDEFGSSVAVLGDTAVVAAAGAGNAGAVFVFRRSGTQWTLDGRIGAQDALKGQRFGLATAFDTGTIAASTDSNPSLGFGAGAVHVFSDAPPAFAPSAALSSADPLSTEDPANDLFGYGLALRGDVLVAGAPRRDLPLGGGLSLASSGQAFVFERTGGVWRLVARLRGTPQDASPIAAGDLFGIRAAFDGKTIVVAATGERSVLGQPSGAVYVYVVRGN